MHPRQRHDPRQPTIARHVLPQHDEGGDATIHLPILQHIKSPRRRIPVHAPIGHLGLVQILEPNGQGAIITILGIVADLEIADRAVGIEQNAGVITHDINIVTQTPVPTDKPPQE